MISIIHPSRKRPVRALSAALTAIRNIGEGVDFEYVLSIDKDDPLNGEYLNLFADHNVNLLYGDNSSAIEAINRGAQLSKGDIIIVLSDDFDAMPENWGKTIIEATQGKENWLLKTNDGAEGWIVTLPIMDRKYYNKFGYIYYPAYKHMFADTDMTNVAEYTNCLIVRNDILFKHNHYTLLNNKDEINDKNNATWDQGENLYLNRYLCDFELKTGTYELFSANDNNQAHINWIHDRLAYIKTDVLDYGFTIPVDNGYYSDKRDLQLSILIATTPERKGCLNLLIREFTRQISSFNGCNLIISSDNKEMSIGEKRQGLLEKAKSMGAEWVVFFDDDDFPMYNYVELIVNSINKNIDIDCLGINGTMTTNNVCFKTWCHRLIYENWEGDGRTKVDGWDYIRPIIHFNPVKLDKALQAGYANERFGEDPAYSLRLESLLKREYFIEKPLFHYRYNANQNHNQKYGIKDGLQ